MITLTIRSISLAWVLLLCHSATYDNVVCQSPEQDDDQENEQAVQQECLDMFSGSDYIMEPGVFNQLKR